MLRHTGSRFPCRWTTDHSWVAGGRMPEIDNHAFYYVTTNEAIAWARKTPRTSATS